MIIIPREKPAIENLNSYYLNIEKLIEHYQGDLGAGVVYFKSPVSEGVLFFDEANLVNGHFEDKKDKIDGQAAITRIIDLAGHNNFFVSVFRIIPERLYFWANLSNSEVLYTDLASDFTDLEALIKKMEAEKLTGYIDVQLNGEREGGLLFFFNGEIIGGSSKDAGGDLDRSVGYREDLIRRSRESGGKFNVRKIFIDSGKTVSLPAPAVKSARTEKPAAVNPAASPKAPGAASPVRIIEMLQNLLGTVDHLVRKNRKIRMDFETLLNRKFVEKIDKYDFLDPFAAEFKYSAGKVTFTGRVSQTVLVNAIIECIMEIAMTLGIMNQLRRQLDPWRKGFADEVMKFDIHL